MPVPRIIQDHEGVNSLGLVSLTEVAPPDTLTLTDDLERVCPALAALVGLFRSYFYMPLESNVVLSGWVLASWLNDLWDKFPILIITSAVKRSGKTNLLELLEGIMPDPLMSSSFSAATIGRLANQKGEGKSPKYRSLIFDEAQSVQSDRLRFESNVATRDLLCGSTSRKGKYVRCSTKKGANYAVEEFNLFFPKVLALIGKPDHILLDRAININMKRLPESEKHRISQFRSREYEPRCREAVELIKVWISEKKEIIGMAYNRIEGFPISNDRMADMLMPLQAVLMFCDSSAYAILEAFAHKVDGREEDTFSLPINLQLLNACREIFKSTGNSFYSSAALKDQLDAREEEPWGQWNRGQGFSLHMLAKLLKQFEIKPRSTGQTRGYYSLDFEDAWRELLPPYTGVSPDRK